RRKRGIAPRGRRRAGAGGCQAGTGSREPEPSRAGGRPGRVPRSVLRRRLLRRSLGCRLGGRLLHGRLFGGGGGLLRRGLLGGRRLLRRRLLGRRLLRGLLRRLLGGALGPLLGEQFEAALGGDLLDAVAGAQGRVGLPVGDVRAETAVLDHDRLLADGVGAQFLQRRLGGRPTTLLGLGVDRQRLLQRDREQLLLGLERPGVRALLQ